ncbi:MAG: magnesium transporter CorA family protein [candidate division WOR-3 bacterium]
MRFFYLSDGGLASSDSLEVASELWGTTRPIWLHADPVDLSFLAETCGFHSIAIEECERETPVPKVEDFGSYLFAELHMPMCIGDRIEVYEMDVFLGKDFLVTYIRQKIPGFSNLLMNRDNISKRISSPARLLRWILDQTFFQNLWELMEDMDDRMDAIEDQLAAWNLNQSVLMRITATNAVIGRIRKSMMFHQRIFEELTDEARDFVSREDMPYILDLADRHHRILSETDYLQQRGETLYQLFVDSKDYQSNEIMKVLTVVATITLPALLIASIYGMNFRYMPELGQWWGYPAAIGLMILVGAIIFIYMKKKKWL